jgi:predicted nucleic acid-binding protein
LILPDTSVWVEHVRGHRSDLADALEAGEVVAHRLVIGELACGHLPDRRATLARLQQLPQARIVSPEEALSFIEARGLAGRGLGYVDVHILAATFLTADLRLWTLDRRLAAAAADLAVAYRQ